jgi:hypothetical protein
VLTVYCFPAATISLGFEMIAIVAEDPSMRTYFQVASYVDLMVENTGNIKHNIDKVMYDRVAEWLFPNDFKIVRIDDYRDLPPDIQQAYENTNK